MHPRSLVAVAASRTPHVLDGQVYAVTRVGNTVVLGGGFSRARNDNSDTALNRNRLLAFDATTGQISTSFVPNPNGTVRTVIPAGDGQTVYVGGNFTSIGGVASHRLARIRVSDGSVVSAFNAGTISGQVRELASSNGRLWLGGAFSHISGKAQPALATVDPATAQNTPYMERRLAGVHRGAVTQREAVEGSGIQGRAWWRTATAADAGSTVSVPLSGFAKGDLTVSAYRGTGGAATVTAHGSKLDETLAAEHTTPPVTATDPTSWVSSYWAGKTSTDLTWTTPASQLLRASTSGSGSGRIVAVAADSGAAVPPGSGSSTATATPEVARVVMFATVIELE